jgi:ABC-2 type transport system permease protein
MPTPTEQPAGTIYDIGYQRYEGQRLGRAHAVAALVGHGLRTVFGIGRGERAKIAPVAVTALVLLPAIIQAWMGAATGGAMRIVSYHDYFAQIEFMFLLLCAAQAPELVSADQHNRVLPLYFSRPVRRTDYVLGKLSALVLAVLAIALLGQFTLLSGRIFASADLLAGWRAERAAVVPILVSTLAAALLIASLSLAVAAWVKARALASAAVIAFILVTSALAPLLRAALPDEAARYAILASPLASLSGTAHWLFGEEPRQGTLLALFDLPPHYFPFATVAAIALAIGLLLARYHRLRV